MFPKHWIYVDEQVNSSVSPKGKQHVDRRAMIQIDDAHDRLIYEGQYTTSLSRAMAQVRAWHKAQELNTILPESQQ